MRHKRIEDLGRETAGARHAFKRIGTVELDDPVAGFDAIVGVDADVLSHAVDIGEPSIKPNRSP